jgi:hypothetical protein
MAIGCQLAGGALKSVSGKALSQRYTNVIRDIGVRRAGTAEVLAYVVEEGGRLTGEQIPVPGAGEIMAGFIRRFGGRDATRVARTAIEVAACQQRDDLVPD